MAYAISRQRLAFWHPTIATSLLVTYTHGSVVESPSADRDRSEHLPGAKTPMPYPRVAIIQGSLNVILKAIKVGKNSFLIRRICAYQFFTRSPNREKQS